MENHTELEIEKAANEARATNKMLLKWAQKQGTSVIRHMEVNRHQHTLSLHWPKVRQGWLGGFASGVSSGFQLGFKTATTLSFKGGLEIRTGNASDVEKNNAEIKRVLSEAVGEASMCWETLDGAGEFQSQRAEAIVNRLYEKFAIQFASRPEEVPIDQPLLPGL